jgi:hypothetical protein
MCHHPWLWSRAKSALTCGAGCGDVYWGEWASDPPAGGDSCDSCGTVGCGGGCGGCWNPLRGLAHLWGYRYAPAGNGMEYDMGYDEGCDSCADSHESYDTIMPGEEVIEEMLPTPKPEAEPEPEPAKQASLKRSTKTINPSATVPPTKTVKHLPASHRTTNVRRK